MTQKQIENIRNGLGSYALEKRFVCRKGKMPIDPKNGYFGAKANDPSTWGSLDQALEALVKYRAKGVDGIGIELGDGLCGIDIDHCVDEHGTVSPQARDVIKVMDSYTESSVSGTGIHIIFEGAIPDGARRKNGLEMYSDGRYFTLTGNLLSLGYDELEVANGI